MSEPEKTPTLNSNESQRFKKFISQVNWCRQKLANFIDHTYTTIVMTVVTIYILFADDIRQLVDDKNVDDGFYTMAEVAFGLFGSEIVLSCFAKVDYFLSFFFWLDIISTASLIFDIGPLSDLILGTGGSGGGAAGAAKLARAGRASRVGTKAGRIVRIVRLIRLIRIVKLYKAAQSQLVPKESIEDDDNDINSKEGTLPKSNTGAPKTGSVENAAIGQSGSINNTEGRDPIERRDSSLPAIRKGTIEHGESKFKSMARAESTEGAAKKDEPKTSLPGEIKSTVSPREAQGQTPEQKQNEEANKTEENQEGKKDEKKEEKKEEGHPNKFELPQETNVGKKLSTLTTKRVITLVMSVLISIPIFDIDTYTQDLTSGESGLNTVWALNQSSNSDSEYAYGTALAHYINYHKDLRIPLVVVNIGPGAAQYITITNEDLLRDSEKQYYNIIDNTGSTVAYSLFDQRSDTHLNAILSISGTLFVTIVLTVAALYFSKDSNDLVLAPIENMLVKVKRIAENPLAAAQIEEEDALMMEKLEKEGKFKELTQKKDGSNYETNILEKTILKLGALLALGFGEAGSNIIAQNMSKSGDVDPMIPGRKVMAIFGFCDIRQFTDATEVLQEGVMVFVNEIAEIVHGTINDYSGAANKNIGDAFLLVWKIPEDEVEREVDDPSNLKLKEGSLVVSALADMATFSFIKVIASVNKSKKLEKYKQHEALNQRIKNYSVKMGFGLHVGWAIEGAIGSEYKIDASYLSPNVNMAARLEAATKQFGVPVLISGEIHKICNADTQKQLRHIDRVTVKGSILPIDLYTCDVDMNKVTVDKSENDGAELTAIQKKQQRVENRMRRDELREKAFAGKVKISKRFFTDKDIAVMRKPYTQDFYDLFKEGMDNYISGNWSKARDAFEITSKMIHAKEKDGPSQTLLHYMNTYGYRAPHDWKGFRELTDK